LQSGKVNTPINQTRHPIVVHRNGKYYGGYGEFMSNTPTMTAEEMLTRGTGNFIHCTDYEDAVKVIKDLQQTIDKMYSREEVTELCRLAVTDARGNFNKWIENNLKK
jgi:hypothetical protein